MMKNDALLGIYIFIVCLLVRHFGQVSTPPPNAVSFVGDNFSLAVESPSPLTGEVYAQWIFEGPLATEWESLASIRIDPHSPTAGESCKNPCSFSPTFSEVWVPNATVEDAGVYEFYIAPTPNYGQTFLAYVIIIDGSPVCPPLVTSAVGSSVNITCSLGFGGIWSPKLTWETDINAQNVTYDVQNGSVTSTVEFGPFSMADTGSSITCVSYLAPWPQNVTDWLYKNSQYYVMHGNYSDNTPSYSDSCSVQLNILPRETSEAPQSIVLTEPSSTNEQTENPRSTWTTGFKATGSTDRDKINVLSGAAIGGIVASAILATILFAIIVVVVMRRRGSCQKESEPRPSGEGDNEYYNTGQDKHQQKVLPREPQAEPNVYEMPARESTTYETIGDEQYLTFGSERQGGDIYCTLEPDPGTRP